MTTPHPLSLRGKRLAFQYAWQGVSYMLRTQPNACLLYTSDAAAE